MKNVSVIIPAYNEQKNIKKVIRLVKKSENVDEIIVVDNNSKDATSVLAQKEGAKVVFCKEQGKGYAMEKGLQEAKNEIVVFIDADINNYSKDVIEKLAEPIVKDEVEFVKSLFERTGGRVTELVAKPLLDILFPEIHKFSQPLSGMIAGKKSLLSKIEFEKDYGVDIGILIDMIQMNVRIKEVHIGKIKNHSQQWRNLEKMSREVMNAIIKRYRIKKSK
jgi:glycosyltransferase involved in cell wall biosynthesis